MRYIFKLLYNLIEFSTRQRSFRFPRFQSRFCKIGVNIYIFSSPPYLILYFWKSNKEKSPILHKKNLTITRKGNYLVFQQFSSIQKIIKSQVCIYIQIHVIISTFFPSSIISKIITERGGKERTSLMWRLLIKMWLRERERRRDKING